MPWIRGMFLFCIALTLGGCVNADTVLDGPNGNKAMCSGVGWGLIGAPVSYISYRHCIDFYKKAGYTREDDNHIGSSGTDVSTTKSDSGSGASAGLPQEKLANSAAQEKITKISTGMHKALAHVKACLAQVNANPRFLDVVVGLVPAKAHVLDTRYPSTQAITEIASWWHAAKQCETAYAAAMRNLVPAYGTVIDTAIAGQGALFHGAALDKHVTWGGLARGVVRVQTEATWQLQVAMNREAAALQKEARPKP